MDIIYFDGYKDHYSTTINPSLLWEYDLTNFDYIQMRNIVVQRVIERGWLSDWYAVLNLYGIDGMRDAIKHLPFLNNKDMHFVSMVFRIPLSEMKCYEKKQSATSHWTS